MVAIQESPFDFSPGLIIRGTIASASVSIQATNTIGIAHVYPNSSEQSIIIDFDYRLAPVHIIDVLGREVMRVAMPAEGLLNLDISSLHPGVYYVIDDQERARFVKE